MAMHWRAGVEVLHKGHVDIARQECELHRAQLIEAPPLSAAAGRDRFAPHRCYLFAQRRILDLYQRREKLCDVIHAVVHNLTTNRHEWLRHVEALKC